jgi:histone demethylase JARID1
VNKRPLDLYKLRASVHEQGGFDVVCGQKKWAEVRREWGYKHKILAALSTPLRNAYQKWIQPYEAWLRECKLDDSQAISAGGMPGGMPATMRNWAFCIKP